MFCKNCGSEITSNQLFCPHCGTKIEQVTPNPIPEQPIPVQVPPNPIPTQVPPNPIPAQVPPNPIPAQVPPNPIPAQGQIPPYPMPNQASPNVPLPPYQAPQGKYNKGPNQAPPIPPLPPIPPYAYDSGKKKNKALIPIVIGVAVLFLIFGIFLVVKFVGYVNDYQNTETEETSDLYIDDDYTDPYTEDTTDVTEDTSEDTVTEDATDILPDDTTAGTDYNMLFSYYELPDVVSIDTDSRFSYYDSYTDTDVISYTFLFNDMEAADSDFYTAVDDYCSLLMSWNGYYYEEDFSYDQYNTSGEYTDYFSKDNTAIGVTASVEDSGRYVYINIYDLTETTDGTTDESTDDASYPNYYYYLDSRDTQYFEFENEVQMENGIAFYLYSANVYDLGDGTAEVDCNMDLAAIYEETYLYTDSFVVVPMDAEGNYLGDASLIEYVADSEGNYISEPYLLDTEYYNNYTVSFVVPEGTTAVSIYGTNMNDGTSSGPVYYFDMEIVEE